MGKRVVKNYPSPRLMETIGATNQTVPEAIGELVANCFDARNGDERMLITVDMRNAQIVVVDNGKGMTDDVLEKAVCIAEDMSQHIERGEGAKGHFGMGFKTSCSTLGGFYEIFTRPVENDNEYHVAFDVSGYSKRPSGADAWDVEIEDKVADGSGPLKNAEHGTAFVIKRLKDRHANPSAVLKHLGKAFKGHLQTDDKIFLIDDNGSYEAMPEAYNFIPGTKIDIDESFGPDGAYHVTGWMALDSQTHNDENYGFNIYRNKQLVKAWDKTWFRPHLMTSRIIGEVSMDFLDATFYKQGLQQSEVWEIVRANMEQLLKPIVKASREISRKHNIDKPAEKKRIVGELRSSYELDEAEDLFEGEPTPSATGSEDKPSVHETIKVVVKERSLILADGSEIDITYTEKTLGGKIVAPFDYIFNPSYEEDGGGELQVIVLLDHPLWEKKIDLETIKVLATSDAIYRALVEELGFNSSEANKLRNEWVWKRTTGSEVKS